MSFFFQDELNLGSNNITLGNDSSNDSGNSTISVTATAHNVDGRLLTISSGNTTDQGGTTNDKKGGDLILQSGQGKGTSGSQIIMKTCAVKNTSDSTLLSLEPMLTLYNPFVTAEHNISNAEHLKIYRYKIGSEIITNIEIDIEGLYNNATDGSSTKVLGNQQTGETANQSSQFDGNLPNNQIKLNSSSNTNDDFYNNKLIYAIGIRNKDYNRFVGSTKIATVGNSFTNADGSYYTIYDSCFTPNNYF